jgi:hypothetical protein
MLIEEVIKRANELMKISGTRYGQALFNALSDIDSGYSEAIQDTEADPFYDDSRVSNFFAYLCEVTE